LDVEVSLCDNTLQSHPPSTFSTGRTSLPGSLWLLTPPLTVTTEKFAIAASLRKRVKKSVKSDELANSSEYPVMPSLFVDVACGEYFSVLYNILSHVGVIMDEQLEWTGSPGANVADNSCNSRSPLGRVGALNTNFDIRRRARGEPKYVVGATVCTCSCKAAGSE
jgi:hypothetical protein